MPYYFVRSLSPLCISKKICATAEETVEWIKEIQKKSQLFRDKLKEEDLLKNKIQRCLSFEELDKYIVITHVYDKKWKKKVRLFKEMEIRNPNEKEIRPSEAMDSGRMGE